jgi:hypothetical protein
VPIATAAETGFSTMMRAGIRLSPYNTRSITSGMPWPRIAAEP